MSQAFAITLNSISKAYKRYHHPAARLKEVLLGGKSQATTFWALQDITLAIPKGSTVGIIGRNGSGKSTLLQIIAGTLQATSGTTDVIGRVSALLELGSGFNPDFTGRQNAFFNGRILGLTHDEIAAKFEEIARFADIGDFIDEPVKTYSSGMFVRLAFAVAINVDPDILIVDEALSVGDEAFQRKCFARIYEMQEKGVTVLFVSHSAASIVELCDRAILLDDGEIICQGVPKVVVANYQKLVYADPKHKSQIKEQLRRDSFAGQNKDIAAIDSVSLYAEHPPQQSGNHLPQAMYDPYLVPQHRLEYQSRGAKIKNPEIRTLEGKSANILCRGEKYLYRYRVYFSQAASKVCFGMLIKTVSGYKLGGTSSHVPAEAIDHIPAQSLIDVEFEFSCTLLPGTYFLNAGVVGQVDGEPVFLDRAIDAAIFKVQSESGLKATGTVDFNIASKIMATAPMTQT